MTVAAVPRTKLHAPEAVLADVVVRARSCDPDAALRELLARLRPQPADAVLEVGFAGGRALAGVAARVTRGFVGGVDPSPLALRHAGRRCRRYVEEGRVELVCGRSDDLSAFADARFDAVYGLHVVCCWPEPRDDLRELHRVLRPGGRLLLGFCPSEVAPAGRGDRASFPVARLEQLLRESGFHAVQTERGRDGASVIAWTQARR